MRSKYIMLIEAAGHKTYCPLNFRLEVSSIAESLFAIVELKKFGYTAARFKQMAKVDFPKE